MAAQLLVEYEHNEGKDLCFQAITPVSNDYLSNLYVAGSLGAEFIIGEVNQTGAIVWIKSIDADLTSNCINSIFVDSEGKILICGSDYTGTDDDGFGFILKFDPLDKVVLWSKIAMQNVILFDIAEFGDGGDYIIGGQEENLGSGLGSDHLLLKADRETGEMVTLSNTNIGLNENIDALCVDTSSGFIFSTGRYEIADGGASAFRMGLRKTSIEGEDLWCKYYLEDAATESRFYPKDILLFDGFLYVVGCGDEFGVSSLKNLFVLKIDLNGNLLATKKIDIAGAAEDGILAAIKHIPGGFLVYGSLYSETWSDVLLASLNEDLDLQWIQAYPFSKLPDAYGIHNSSSLAIISQRAFQVGVNLNTEPNHGMFANTQINSGLVGGCEFIKEASCFDYESPYEGIFVSSNVSCSLTFADMTGSIGNVELTSELLCGEIDLINNSSAIEDQIKVFPSPSRSQFSVAVPQEFYLGNLVIVNGEGCVVYSGIVARQVQLIEIGFLPAGAYHIRVDNGRGHLTNTLFVF